MVKEQETSSNQFAQFLYSLPFKVALVDVSENHVFNWSHLWLFFEKCKELAEANVNSVIVLVGEDGLCLLAYSALVLLAFYPKLDLDFILELIASACGFRGIPPKFRSHLRYLLYICTTNHCNGQSFVASIDYPKPQFMIMTECQLLVACDEPESMGNSLVLRVQSRGE